ncbi:flagellar biosynthesis anti-sigma factor FlgM [Candidatus Nitrospira allomarina]|jgi:anti-sigma28 factor (negative regulator of flagellin synthesis)|uniref:flagellar biosynthesis anti-sigma factor FlgM n=1 Tax=Candidatus Nitrospira allomarina TaxID=3020900 RepID=UPI0035E3C415
MNQLSSIPPKPPGDVPSCPPKEMALSSPDDCQEASALASNSAKDDRTSPSIPSRKDSFYLEQMSQIPDVRQDKIAHFQQAIDSQNYVISAENLADSLIQELHPHPEET